MDKYYLRLQPESKHGSMTHPVLGLEKILVKDIVVGNMTIVAIGNPAVRTMTPGSILRGHDMTVHTGLRLIRQVRRSLADINQKEKKPNEDPCNNQYWKSPVLWRKYFRDDQHKLVLLGPLAIPPVTIDR
jgi:hypothetical protein